MNKSASLLGCHVGDKIVIPNGRTWGNAPQVDFAVYTITKRTPTQLVATPEEGFAIIRARLSDGSVIGMRFTHAHPATPEILQKVAEQQAMRERYHEAGRVLDELFHKPLHLLKLSIPQMEKLAQAWVEVKAMAAPIEAEAQEA